jgi:hypothetical protein
MKWTVADRSVSEHKSSVKLNRDLFNDGQDSTRNNFDSSIDMLHPKFRDNQSCTLPLNTPDPIPIQQEYFDASTINYNK